MNIIIYGSSNERYCPLCKSNELQDDPIRMEVFCRTCGCVCLDQTLMPLQQKIELAELIDNEIPEKKKFWKNRSRK